MPKHLTSYPPFLPGTHVYIILIYAKRERECIAKAVVKAEFTKRTGIQVVEANKLLRSKECPFMLANLDGVSRHPTYGTCVFEAKTASAYKAAEAYIGQRSNYLILQWS